jgi:type I restriction enzyme S subunit
LVVGAFERLAGSLDQGILANSAESDTLAELREVLLPRVISGELRITAVRDEITAQ